MTYISWFSDFALYLEYYLLDKCHTWDISSLWPNYWRQNISLLVWPIFHGSVILPYILNTICWINVTPGILVPCDPMNDHLLYLGHCDLYFMLQWFCLLLFVFKTLLFPNLIVKLIRLWFDEYFAPGHVKVKVTDLEFSRNKMCNITNCAISGELSCLVTGLVLISAQKHSLWVLVRTASARRF